MQRMRCLFRSSLVYAALTISAGCAREIPIEPEVNPLDFTVAQFDPTNPVPVLQLIPTPTALAENADGTINFAAVAPEACELPSPAQCLQFANGWPTNLPLTLFFSREPDAESLDEGITVYEQAGATLVEIPTIKVWQPERDAIPDACRTEFDIAPEQIPPGGQVLVVPAVDAIPTTTTTRDFKRGTRYVVKVESRLDASGNVVGLRDQDGRPVEPAALFRLLNVADDPATVPVTDDGTITSALLRSQVTSTVLARLGLDPESLTPEQERDVAEAVAESGRQLFPLFRFFNATTEGLLAADALNDRRDAILVNAWTTEPTEIAFDPGRNVLPFPNSQLLTVEADTATGLRVNLPLDADASPTEAGLIMGLNSLNGFSTTASISFQTTRPLDVTSIADNVVMYEVDDSDPNAPIVAGDPIPLRFSTADGPLFTVYLRAERPLRENTHHVVVVKTGLRDVDGNPVRDNSTFTLLKSQDPIIDGSVNPAFVPALQCSLVADGFPIDTPVEERATLVEVGLARARWAETIATIGRQPAAIPADDVLLAFAYHTQDINSTVELIRDTLLPGPWQDLGGGGPNVDPTGIVLTGTTAIASAARVVDNLCVPLCQQGAMPGIPVEDCAMRLADVEQNALCQTTIQLVTRNLDRATLYDVRGYTATAGNPFVAGTFTEGTVAAPRVVDLPTWVVVPAAPVPANGWPVAIFQHGLGGFKEAGFYIAGTLAERGFATVLMDMPFHGTRASDLVRTTTAGTELCVDIDPAQVVCTPNSDECFGGCDNVRDVSGTGFLSTNVFSARDNYRQATVDHLTLRRALREEGRAGGVWSFLDGDRVGYVGQSLGGVAGGNFAAYATDLLGVVLNVPGGSLSTIITNTVPEISAGLYEALAAVGICTFNVPGEAASGCQDTPAFRQFVISAQWALDPGDPLANAPQVGSGLGVDRVLMQMSRPDPVITNVAARFLADAYGLDVNDPAGPYQLYDFSALPQSQVGSGCHSFLLAPICGECVAEALCETIGAQTQAAVFLETEGQTITGQRPSAIPGFVPSCDNPCGP